MHFFWGGATQKSDIYVRTSFARFIWSADSRLFLVLGRGMACNILMPAARPGNIEALVCL
jgi:hypothetical protein